MFISSQSGTGSHDFELEKIFLGCCHLKTHSLRLCFYGSVSPVLLASAFLYSVSDWFSNMVWEW
jgi:hypothetical protein